MDNFWTKLNKGFLALAPMAGVGDSAFRQICKEFGADVLYSEMASATALVYNPEKTLELLKFNELERPYVVQLFGAEPSHFIEATKIITSKIKPDGIDINFGCPVKKVIKQGAGAILMNDFKKSRTIIENVISSTGLPVSIKTRTRVGDKFLLDFLDYINDLDVKALMIHGRTFKQGFSGEIDFETIRDARNKFKGTLIANGGIKTPYDYNQIIEKTFSDGVALARGVYGRPWLFSEIKEQKEWSINRKSIYDIALKHAKLALELKGAQGIVEMRKHLCWYVSGLPNASALRRELIQVNTLKEIEKILC